MTDIFSAYERGLEKLLERLGKDHPRYVDVLVLQSRLLENLAQARRYGDTEARRAERAQIVDQLNALALKHLDLIFNELCGLERGSGTPGSSTTAAGARSVVMQEAHDSVIITGDHNTVSIGTAGQTEGVADRAGLERALTMARRALAILEEQVAGFGALHVPAHKLIELEEKRREVAELERRLQHRKE